MTKYLTLLILGSMIVLGSCSSGDDAATEDDKVIPSSSSSLPASVGTDLDG